MLPNTDHSETTPTQNSTAEPENPDSLEDDSAKKTAGRWTKEEHQRFVDGLKKFGKNWKRIEEHVGTRSGAQIRSHAQKFFIRLEKEFDIESKNSKGVPSGKDIPGSLRKASDCSNSTTCSYQAKSKVPEHFGLGQDTNAESSKVLESLISNKSKNMMNTIPKLSEAETPICLAPVVNNISFATNNLALNHIFALNSIQNFQQKQRRMSIDAFPPTFPTTPLFDAFTSNLKPSDNALGLSRLTELMGLTPQVGLASNIQPYYPTLGLNNLFPLNNIGAHNFDQLAALPPVRNPRKFSEDNVLIQSRQDTLQQRFAPTNWTEFELLAKRMKKL